MARKSRLVSELGDDVFDDTIVEKQHKLDPHKRNYIVGFSVLGVLAIAIGMVYYAAVNFWLYDYQNMPYLEYSINPSEDTDGLFKGKVTASITKLKSESGYPSDFKVPKNINGHPITRIDDQAFAGCDRLTKVTLPDNIVELGDEVFLHCEKLKTVNFSKNLVSIGNNCFAYTPFKDTWENYDYYHVNNVLLFLNEDRLLQEYNKSKFAFVANSQSTYASTFDNDTLVFSLENLSVIGGTQNADTHIDSWMDGIFSSFDSLIFFEAPSYLEYVTDHAFDSCSNLKTLVLGPNNKEIGNYSFSDCESLDTIIVSQNNVTSIGNYAFANTKLSLTSLHEGLLSIGEGAFSYCRSMTSMTIPSTITDIPDYAFSNTPLESVSFTNADKIKSIGVAAFQNSKLSSFTFPKNVDNISGRVLYGCEELSKVTMYNNGPEKISSYAFADDELLTTIALLNDDGSTYKDETGTFNLPRTISSTAGRLGTDEGHCFENTNPTKAVFNVNVQNLSDSLFQNCENLETVEWIDIDHTNLRNVGSSVFENCHSLTSFEFPDLVNRIGLYCFRNCENLASIALPEMKNWNTYEYNIATTYGSQSPSLLSTLNKYLFSGCSSLGEVTIPSTVSRIESYAFENCSSLNYIFIPSNVTSISSNAFKGDTNLYVSLETSILPESSRYVSGWDNDIKGYALASRQIFISGNFVVSLNLDGETLTIIDLVNAENITSLVIPSSLEGYTVTCVNDGFLNTSNTLTSVTLPDTLTSLGEKAFENCPNLAYTTENGFSYLGSSSNSYLALVKSVELGENEEYLVNASTKVVVASAFKNPAMEFTTDYNQDNVALGLYIGTADNDYFVLVESTSKATEVKVNNNTKIIAGNAFVSNSSSSIVIPSNVDYVMKAAVKGNASFSVCCEVTSKPAGWDFNWDVNPTKNPYYWGTTGECSNFVFKACINLDGTARLISYIDTLGTKADVPTTITPKNNSQQEYNVSEIASGCFKDNSKLTSIYIPNTIVKVGEGAVSNVPNATIYLEGSSIGANWDANWNLDGLPVYYGINENNHIIVDNVDYVIQDDHAIVAGYQGGLKQVQLSNSVTVGGHSYQVTEIGESAFAGSLINSIVLSSNITTVGPNAFKNCDNLIIYVEASTEPAGFDDSWNPNLRPVYFGVGNSNLLKEDGMEFIKDPNNSRSAILTGHNPNIEEVDIPDTVTINNETLSVTTIGERAFEGSLVSFVRFSETTNVSTIKDYAFTRCEELIYMIIPNTVTSVGSYIFLNANPDAVIYIVSESISGWESDWSINQILGTGEDEIEFIRSYIGLGVTWEYNPDTHVPQIIRQETDDDED